MKGKYDWDNWQTGIWYLRRGVDYTCPTISMQQQVHQMACRMNKTCRTRIDRAHDGIVFEMRDREVLPCQQKQP